MTVRHFADALPDRMVSNSELCATVDSSDEWIRSRTGIESRRFLEDGAAASDLALRAARSVLSESGLPAVDVDAIVLATVNPDQPFPSTALTVAQALGAVRAVPIDLTQAACSGGLLAIEIAASMIGERYRNILVLASEVLSRQMNPTDRTTRIFFGDAAGGALVSAERAVGRGIRSSVVESELDMSVGIRDGGSRHPLTADSVAHGRHYVFMDGPRVWKLATTMLPTVVRRAVDEAGLALDDVDHFVFHQANRNIVETVVDSLGVPRDKAPITVDRLGNTGAASIFTVLAELERAALLRPGTVTVIATIGAGFIWGALVLVH
ncbi:3-oxoacyl-ACP synthase III family protein [Rhodococcoides kyotonense]|uniref:3-oxoacyl-ACP synthase III family protein n=1 Tax=Rhodococcoides kyotonense TaxID=398843 RepID=UPI001FE277B7|nr:ketoacyl-ACP synthase III [Rhodococcus kyotonensis]